MTGSWNPLSSVTPTQRANMENCHFMTERNVEDWGIHPIKWQLQIQYEYFSVKL